MPEPYFYFLYCFSVSRGTKYRPMSYSTKKFFLASGMDVKKTKQYTRAESVNDLSQGEDYFIKSFGNKIVAKMVYDPSFHENRTNNYINDISSQIKSGLIYLKK